MSAMTTANRLHFRYIHRDRVARLSRAFADAIPPDTITVLDVGTGDGLLASEIAALRPELRFAGVDVHPRPETYIPVEMFDGHRLPRPDDAVDVVTFSDVLHHTENQEELLVEAARVARRAVVIKDHLADTRMDAVVLRMMDFAGNRHAGVSLPYNYRSTITWHDAFQRIGLRVRRWDNRPQVYGAQLSWAIGRRMHVLTVLTPESVAA